MAILAFLGPHGTHSEEAAAYINDFCKQDWSLQPYRGIHEAIYAVHNGDADYCFVPIENSIEGSVRITLDTLMDDIDLKINMELIWQVHNQLLLKTGTTAIKKIISHPQALAQCRKYIQKNYPQAEIIEVVSTAHAAKMVADGLPDAAAIASKRSGQIYNLQTADAEIQDISDNVTRFILLGKKQEILHKEKPVKTLLICQIDGSKAGSLCGVLNDFANSDINMTRIESRPARTGLGNYVFFIEIETANVSEGQLTKTLQIVQQKCLWLKNMGYFPIIK